jgi:hypothetical protein
MVPLYLLNIDLSAKHESGLMWTTYNGQKINLDIAEMYEKIQIIITKKKYPILHFIFYEYFGLRKIHKNNRPIRNQFDSYGKKLS